VRHDAERQTHTIGRTGPWTDRHRTNGSSQRRAPECEAEFGPAFAVARQVVHHFAAAVRVADVYRSYVEMCGQCPDVDAVVIHAMRVTGAPY
jgi:hypothetical protein